MPGLLITAILCCFLICLRVGAAAQENTTTNGSALNNSQVNAETTAAVSELLEITGSRKNADVARTTALQSFKEQFPGLPEAYWTELGKSLSYDSLITQVLPIYTSHWSLQDIKGLIAFYKTPLGQKLIRNMPEIIRESMILSVKRSKEIQERVMAYYRTHDTAVVNQQVGAAVQAAVQEAQQ